MTSHVADGECQYENCVYCSSGLGHGPVLAFYDPAEGTYLLPEEDEVRCVARWASGCPYEHNEGDICGDPAGNWAGDVPLCDHHFMRQTRWWLNKERREWEETFEHEKRLHEQRLRQEEERDQRQLERSLKRIARTAEAKSPYSVVYYIRRISDGVSSDPES